MYSKEEIENAFTELIDEYQEFGISVITEQYTTINKVDSDGRECNIYHINSEFNKYVKSIKELRPYESLIENLVYDSINVTIKINSNKLLETVKSKFFHCVISYEKKLKLQLKLVEDIKFCLIRLPEFELCETNLGDEQIFNIKYQKIIEKDYINELILDSNLPDKDKLIIKHNLFEKNNI